MQSKLDGLNGGVWQVFPVQLSHQGGQVLGVCVHLGCHIHLVEGTQYDEFQITHVFVVSVDGACRRKSPLHMKVYATAFLQPQLILALKVRGCCAVLVRVTLMM